MSPAAWRANGLELDGVFGKSEGESLALFGMPLSGLMDETLGDGRSYQIQWFERARFELHPQNQPPYHVLLGLLGNEIRDAGGAPPAPAPAPVQPLPVQPPSLPAPTYNNCQADPNPEAAPNYPIAIVAVDKDREFVTLRNVGSEPIDLGGERHAADRETMRVHRTGRDPMVENDQPLAFREARYR